MHKELIGSTEFTFRIADKSESLMEEIYKLRYQVYCQECNFIKPEDYPQCRETDKFDQYSKHFVTEDYNGVIGTARLILDSPYGFPLENRCGANIDVDLSTIDRARMAEISRLAISKTYRRRRSDGMYYSPDYGDSSPELRQREELKRIKPMAFGLYREIYQECKRHGITHCLALMEKSLWLLLRIHHFHFMQIGDAIHYYGPVAPYLCEISAAEQTLKEQAPQLYAYLREGLDPELDAVHID